MKLTLTVGLLSLATMAGGCSAAEELAGNCVKNAFGAEFCGEEARQYCSEFGGPGCATLGYDSKGRMGRELDKADREYDEAMREAEREQRKLDRQLEQDQRELEADLEELGY